MNSETPLVSVVCITYNHEGYILQALDGFVMQQCSFPIEIIVHDDASTDNTANIIKEYLEKCSYMRAIFQKENQYSKNDFDCFEGLYKRETRGKYIAVCEGDDYWIDPLKLEKQIHFLETNPDYGMSYTKAKIYNQKENKFRGVLGSSSNTFDDCISFKASIPTLTVVMRKNLIAKYYDEVKPSQQGWLQGDLPKWMWFAKNSKMRFEDCVTSVYRELTESASHFVELEKEARFFKSKIRLREYFIERYGVEDKNTLHEFFFINIWGIFKYACKLNDDQLFNEVQKLICERSKVGRLRLFYIKLVLFCRPMRYFFLIKEKLRVRTNVKRILGRIRGI